MADSPIIKSTAYRLELDQKSQKMNDPETDTLLSSKSHKLHSHHAPGAKKQSDCFLSHDADFKKRIQKG